MHFQIEVPAPSHVGVMQPPTGVQKWEWVLCLPLARSALPCRLIRHSALGTVWLCPVGLARHSAPAMVLLYTVGSAQLALPLCTGQVIKMQFGTAQCSTEAARCNSRVAHQMQYETAQMQHRMLSEFYVRADGWNLQNTGCRTYASNKNGLTVAANRYQMQQTTAARRMQFSECYDKRSSRHTAITYVVLGIL
ncbi:hypothetical protein Acr_00g0006250 [Actinidia rufa]|uniref:Uncharacterized protein n=1 Tax=Actinidia rufa TaxID=165716 RepID=A0A7J0D9P0_9ERIC|nr:hypothetical protein Acr_00g0006250 [Actinidia rufa]